MQQDVYTIKARGMIPPDYTGELMSKLYFKNGIAHTNKYAWVKLATTKGCLDITPPDVRQRLLNRPLKKILVIRNAAFGDGLIITPALRALREKYPDAQIDLFGRQDSKVVYQGLPFIDSLLSVRETELGVLFDSYDEVFDMVHSIECRPEADYSNALDVACQIMGTQIPSDPVPYYKSTPAELAKAQELLKLVGVSSQDKIVVFQAEATAKVRSLPPTTTLNVANHFAKQGYKVVMVGHDMPIMHTYLSHCPSCGAEAAFHSPEGKPVPFKCSRCQKDVVFNPEPNHPGVKFLHPHFSTFSIREHFAVANYAHLMITVDSAWSHLGAALRKPSVIIFSNYHPFTRTKYYDQCSVVAPDYENKVPCGPCNSLTGFCHMFPNQLAPCTTSITSNQIIEAAQVRLQGKNPVWQELRDTPPAEYKDIRKCPCCDSENHSQLTCKGKYIYVQCQDCQTIYTAQYPDKMFWDRLPKLVHKNVFYRPSRHNNALDAIRDIKVTLKRMEIDYGDDLMVCDLVGPVSDFHVGRPSLTTMSNQIVELPEDGNELITTPVTMWVEGIQEAEDPLVALRKIYDRMPEDSVLVLIGPLADKFSGINSLATLNPCVAGLNTVIPSKRAYTQLLRDVGFKKCEIAANDVNAMVIGVK